jgi:hypothetical protein
MPDEKAEAVATYTRCECLQSVEDSRSEAGGKPTFPDALLHPTQ